MKIDSIEKDFNFKNNKKDIIELKFLKKISKSPVYISRKTGLIFHNTLSSIKVVQEWSNRVFGNKMFITKKGYGYTDNIPEMRARHYYVLDTLNSFTKIKEKRIIDFASGQGDYYF